VPLWLWRPPKMTKKAFLLRMSPELWEELNRWAADELRSINGQIEYVLRQAVIRERGRLKEPEDKKAKEPRR
jgi:hypothetical protein